MIILEKKNQNLKQTIIPFTDAGKSTIGGHIM